MTIDPKYLNNVTRQLSINLTNEGKLIEAGWVAFEQFVLPKDAGAAQRRDMRAAFFAGAQHLFASVITIMDEDREPTDADLHKMDMISAELDNFIDQELSKRIHGDHA